MTNRDIFKAAGGISDGLIDEAAAPRKSHRGVISGVAALAACAAIALIVWQPREASETKPAESAPRRLVRRDGGQRRLRARRAL